MARKSRVSYEKTALVTPHEFLQKSHENLKFLLLGSKGFCKAVLVCRLRALKTSISLGTWFLYRVYPIRKPSVTEILHSLFTYTPIRDDPNDNRCTYNIDNQYCLLLNILGDTSFSGKNAYNIDFEFQKLSNIWTSYFLYGSIINVFWKT